MKCFEVTNCSEKIRSACYVWTCFRDHPEDMEDLKCWVINGTYHENKEQTQQCKKCTYYLRINRESGISARQSEDIAIVSCSGTVNFEKAGALARAWEMLKKHNKYIVMLDVAQVHTIYSCGLSVLVKMHKETAEAGGMLVIVGGRDHVREILHSSRLTRIFHLAPEEATARQLFDAEARKKAAETETARKMAEAASIQKAEAEAETARQAAEAAKPKLPAPKKFVRCWEYWNGRNPNNATSCDECFHKQNPKAQACWVVEGLIDGVMFHFVNEECLACPYFEEFGKAPQG